jgi:predicted CxxxxCH...CXXCH cytochrome family protein
MVFCAVVIAIVAVLSSYVPGSHDWQYDYSSSSTEKCTLCHEEIEAEILSMPSGAPHRASYVAYGCSFCHVNTTIGAGVGNHSGFMPECQDCHPETEPERDGDSEYGTLNFTSSWEAHKQLYDDVTGTDHDPGKNQACMACHTRVDVIVRYNRPQWYNFTISSSWTVTNVDTGPQYDGGEYSIEYSTSDLGKHYFLAYKNCSTADGCHQDVDYSRTSGGEPRGISGGHHSNISAAHPNTENCTYCHWGEDPTKDYHAARSINCTYSGCHSPTSSNMTALFTEIDSNVGKNARGDLCWGCHSGFDWIDAGGGLELQVETERNYNVSWWTGSEWRNIYPDTNVNCSSCHNDSLPNVPPIPEGSSKYIDHDTIGNYGYGSDGSSGCLNCHDENWAPHENPHDIQITYEDYVSSMGNGFCNTSCHYSVIDSRPGYVDTTTNWMADIYTSFTNANGLHQTSTLINSTGSVKCWDCHPEHEFMPDDGGLSVPGCGATNLDVSCHVTDQSWGNKTDTPSSHGSNWVSAGRDNCIEPGCHEDHNYTYKPSEGHNPGVASCHGTGGDGGCEPNTNSHPAHIDSTITPTSYNFDCGECHWDTVSDPSESDGTFGTIKHNNGTVDVNFDTTSNGIATYGGSLSGGRLPTYEGGNGSCTGTYCHSNAFNASSGVGFIIYESPDWNGGSILCGDCHGIPNYNNGTAWREMGGTVTGNSPTHYKHTRNFGGINATRSLFWVDATPSGSQTPPFGWQDSEYDSGEAIIQDLNNNRMLDYGVLNGGDDQSANPPESPDNVYVNGTADLTDFVAADNIWYWDTDTDGTWDRGEDIYIETGGGGNAGDEWNPSKDDFIIYLGSAQEIVANDNTNTADLSTATGDPLMYLDSDHDNVYCAWWNSGEGQFSGVDEPLIYVQSNKATGDDLDSSDEVLQGMSDMRWWYTDFNRWYDFDCSECHYESSTDSGGLSSGNGTYGSVAHVNMSIEVAFDTTGYGIASKNGTYAANASAPGAWDSIGKQCYGIWCHSDGFEDDQNTSGDVGNGFPDWSGSGVQDDQHDYHTIKPNWTDTTRSTVYCGSCHYGWDKPMDFNNPDDRPNTGGHQLQTQHTGADVFGWHSDDDAALCIECHWRFDTYNTAGENQWWRPYGSYKHVDGEVWIGDEGWSTPGLFGPLSAGQAYSSGDGCHNTWPDNWRSGYSTSGC